VFRPDERKFLLRAIAFLDNTPAAAAHWSRTSRRDSAHSNGMPPSRTWNLRV